VAVSLEAADFNRAFMLQLRGQASSVAQLDVASAIQPTAYSHYGAQGKGPAQLCLNVVPLAKGLKDVTRFACIWQHILILHIRSRSLCGG